MTSTNDVFSNVLLSTLNGVVLWALRPFESGSVYDDYAEGTAGIYSYREPSANMVFVAKTRSQELMALMGLDKELIEGMLRQLAQEYAKSVGGDFGLPDTFIPNALAREKLERQKKADLKGRTEPAAVRTAPPGLLGAVWTLVTRPFRRIFKYPSMDQMIAEIEFSLQDKNVAVEVTQTIVEAIRHHFELTQTPLTRANLRFALCKAIQKYIQQDRKRDLLSEISHFHHTKQTFVICIMGTNGVGKSTTLAKLAYHLVGQSAKTRVLIAACDTFRSGAVEQLKQHCNSLGLDLFEKGYGIDPPIVAAQALDHARLHDYDVLIVDTAGRMQANQGLMANLSKLVRVLNPQMNVFVGEALVGNDSVDQIAQFDKNLQPQSEIHGIILTKFDTVANKIGAALSVAYKSGKPILYVGTGQQYGDLNTLRIDDVVECLLN